MSPKRSDIGPLEMEVLGILDGAGAPVSVSLVKERLAKVGRDLAYTTVMTVLVRLFNKGLVRRSRDGRQYLYSVGREVKQSLLNRLTRSFFRNDRLRPILALLEEGEDLSAEELRELRGRIDRKIRQAEKRAKT